MKDNICAWGSWKCNFCKIKTTNGNSRNLGSASKTKIKRKNWNLITSFVISKTTSWGRKKITKAKCYEQCSENRPLHRQLLFLRDLGFLKHPNCDASNQSTLRNLIKIHKIWNHQFCFKMRERMKIEHECWLMIIDSTE